MNKYYILYNPYSGDRRFKDALDACAETITTLDKGSMVYTARIVGKEDMSAAIANTTDGDRLIISGGDGTVNMAINAMKAQNKNNPLGIIPSGTANDFASHINMPKDPREAAAAIATGKIAQTDLGRANDQFFCNVCGGGLFINVSHSLTGDNFAKSIFGKLAYYIKGLGQLPNITPLPLHITTPTAAYQDEFSLFLALNSGGCGGFHKIAPWAKINDGYLDFIAFRAMQMKDIAGLFLKILQGEHLDDRRILFSHESQIKIELMGTNKVPTDVDGEPGPPMPINITCEKGALQLIMPR